MNRPTATHEAGHAVGRLLTASLMGYKPAEAVELIEIGGSFVTMDNGERMRSLGQTVGPFVSLPLETALKDYASGRTGVDFWAVAKKAGTLEDRRISMATKMLICVMGAAAEAKLQRLPEPISTFMSAACAGDRSDFSKCCTVMGLTDTEALDAQREFLSHARSLVRNEAVWAAINAIAFNLVDAKEDMSGQTVADLAWPLLSQEPGIQALPSSWVVAAAQQA